MSELFIRAVGEGPPLVVLHGGPDFDHEYLRPELEPLADAGVRVVFYDQRGRGRSWHGEGPDDVSIHSEIADLDRVRASTGADRVALLGHSFGALLAAEYAVRHPERVSSLILLNPAPLSHAGMLALRAEIVSRATPEALERMASIAADTAYAAGHIGLEAERYRLHFARTVGDPARLTEVVRRLRLAFSPASVVAARAIEDRIYADTWDRPDYDLLPALGRVDVPTLVIHGKDDFVPRPIVDEIASAIPGARLVVLPTSHFSSLEAPEEVRRLIVESIRPGHPPPVTR